MILNRYPLIGEIEELLLKNENLQIQYFVQQWLTEGIPFAFKNNPILFEEIRYYYSEKLEINPKEITLIGSGRIGFSLAGRNNFGKEYNKNSDLDFSIISEKMFNDCFKEFEIWKEEYKSKKAIPKNNNAKIYWQQNLVENINQFNRGFIDSNRVPNLYHTFSIINNLKFLTLKKWGNNEDLNVHINKVSFRIYKSWDSFLKQQKLNLKYLKKSLIE